MQTDVPLIASYPASLTDPATGDSVIFVQRVLPGTMAAQCTHIMELAVNDLCTVHEAVHPARSRWYNLGLQLHVPVDTLDSIERERGDDGDHLRNLLKYWLKSGAPTWGALSHALKSPTVGEGQLAKKLDVRAARSQTLQLQSKPMESTSTLITEEAISTARLRINELEEKYHTLMATTQEVVRQKAPRIEEFRDTITLLPTGIKREQQRYLKDHLSYIYQAKSINEIFGYLNLGVWDYLNFGLLERIVAVYGDPATEKMMEEYTASVQSFRKSTPLNVFLKAQPEGKCPEICPSLKQHLQEVIFKHHRLSPDCSLDDIESIRLELAREFCLPEFVVILARIEQGSISIVWILPISLTAILKKKIGNRSFQFIQQTDVVEVAIAGTRIFLSGSGHSSVATEPDTSVEHLLESTLPSSPPGSPEPSLVKREQPPEEQKFDFIDALLKSKRPRMSISTEEDTGMVSRGSAPTGDGPQEEPVLPEQQCEGGQNHLHWCDMCSHEEECPKHNIATAHCQTCKRYICDFCRDIHSNVRDYKGHNVIPLTGYCSTLVVDIKPRIGRVDEQVSHHMQSDCEIICTQTVDGIHVLVGVKGVPIRIFLREPTPELGLPVRVIECHGIDGLTMNSDGQLIASEKRKGEVSVLEKTGKKLRVIRLSNFPQCQIHNSSLKTSFSCPSGVAVDKEGCIYVADCENHSLVKFVVDGSDFKIGSVVCKRGSEAGELLSPGGVKVSEKGEVFVCDCGNNRVQIFDSNLKFVRCFGKEGTSDGEFRWPLDLDFDSRGNIFVSDMENHRIQVFDEKENYCKSFGGKGSNPGQLNNPVFLFIDRRNDYLYVSENSNHRISVFQTSGDFVQVLTYKTTWPKGITVDKDGFLYVGQRDENILVFQALKKTV